MTPQERAEKINKYIHGFHSQLDIENFIASQIEEAEREAREEAENEVDRSFERGWNDAREKAKRIARKQETPCADENLACNCGMEIADLIDKMEP